MSRDRPADLLYLLAAYVLALPVVLVADQVAASADLTAVVKLLFVGTFAWHAFVLLRRGVTMAAGRLALGATAGLMWTVVLGMAIYQVVAATPFSLEEAFASLYDTRKTLELSLGAHGVAIALGALAALLAVCVAAACAVYRALPAWLERFQPSKRAAVLCAGALSYFAASDVLYVGERAVYFPGTLYAQRYVPAPVLHDYSRAVIRPGDSVFILQLESVNADALFDRAADPPGFRPRVPQPGLETIVEQGGGTLFPLFWANGERTNRAWESVLCGVSGNVGGALSLAPERLPADACLPAQLAKAGYATLFFYSYFDLQFYNFGAFAKRAGFQEVLYGERLMRPGDARHEWGFDDCAFYGRAFDELARRPRGERQLAYFEVGMNHVPFVGAKYLQSHPFRPARSFVEHYLNSVSEQDHCLLEFWRRFRQLGRDDVHLFIMPDHSVGVVGIPPRPDGNFAVWLAYVPPARQATVRAARLVHSPVPSQAQIYPTVLELLGAPRSPRSFAFALRGEPAPGRYDDCHMLSRGGNALVVRRNGQRFAYRLDTREVTDGQGGREKMSLGEFQERYACGRG